MTAHMMRNLSILCKSTSSVDTLQTFHQTIVNDNAYAQPRVMEPDVEDLVHEIRKCRTSRE